MVAQTEYRSTDPISPLSKSNTNHYKNNYDKMDSTENDSHGEINRLLHKFYNPQEIITKLLKAHKNEPIIYNTPESLH